MVRTDGSDPDAGKVVEDDPPRRLAYTLPSIVSEADKGERPSRVTFMIEPFGKLVKLTLTQEDFAEGGVSSMASRRGGQRSCRA